ncbi:unnamed protein product [Effrenium voratum]|uniref:Glycosyl transferase family 1 domain-containing protein n=1 Tax=Effrenium voratum TaxID=2562239 RepID=A0AA36MSH3_9DINO|nr:unnamed protein product [Effrenium voratum]
MMSQYTQIAAMPSALVCAQAFPPLLKQAGGVAKDYLALCRALIDGLGWHVTLVSPVNVRESGEADVLRWLQSGQLVHAPAWALEASNNLGVAVFMDFFSTHNTATLVQQLLFGGHSLCFLDDSCMRIAPLMLMRGLGIPSIATTHSDVPSHPVYHESIMMKMLWWLHLASAFFATAHASVAKVYARSLWERYRVPVQCTWPPVLWSDEFRQPLHVYDQAASQKRASWIQKFGFRPKAIFLFAGRWSAEKRIHLLLDAVPEDCGLVIVGDSDADYADQIEASRRRNVLPQRGMLGAQELRIAYAASDLFVSASTCETLGNTVVEAWSSGTPVAIQPAGGHLEFVKDNENSYLVDFDDSNLAREHLASIVAGGTMAAVEPALSKMGEHFRTLNFAAEIKRCLVDPPLQAAAPRSGWRWPVEMLFRALLILACCLVWPVTTVWSRAYFALSCDPVYRYVEPGTASEPAADAKVRGCRAQHV